MVSRVCQEAARPLAVHSGLRESIEKRLGYIGERLLRETEQPWIGLNESRSESHSIGVERGNCKGKGKARQGEVVLTEI